MVRRCVVFATIDSFSALTLTVTQANANAVELYKKLGFSVTRVFDAFVWEG